MPLDYPVETTTLNNGLRVVVSEDHASPVRGQVIERAATEDDPAGVGPGQAGDDRQERGLAGAVGAGDRVPAGGQVEVDVEAALGPPGLHLQAHAAAFVVRA